MLNFRKLLPLCLMALLTVGAAKAVTVDQMTQKGPFDYSKFTYEWIDSAGKTQTAKLTAKAEDPRQIMALLAYVYTNPEIPGENYAYSYNGVDTGYVDYDANAKLTTWLPNYYSGTVKQPAEGRTVLLVEVYNDWDTKKETTEALSYIKAAYKSVQLLDRNKYIPDSVNPGYLFSINGLSSNRFFFISKGKRRTTNTLPLHRMFEQISPSTNDAAEKSFYPTLAAGNAFNIEHDCWNVTGARHEFVVASSGENYSFKNMTLFLPDRRFENTWNGSNPTDRFMSYGITGKDYKPKNLMYTCTQGKPTAEKVSSEDYQVNLNWATSLDNKKLGVNVPQYYYIYTVENGETKFLDSTINIQEYHYPVKMKSEGYTITYIIKASPIESNIEAWSGTQTVDIPAAGKPFFVQGASYRSRYDMDAELNIYKNQLDVRANSNEDFANLSGVKDAYDVVRINPDSTESTIAHVQFGGTAEVVTYKVSYEEKTQDLTNKFDKVEPDTEGTLTSATATLALIDRFSASTAKNAQPTGYSYVLRYSGDARSNKLDVPVYKTASAVALQSVTKDEVDADTKHTLKSNNAVAITFEAANNAAANIQQYTVYRDEIADSARSGKAEVISGGYNVTDRTADGNLSSTHSVAIAEGKTADVTVVDYKAAGTAAKGFVPVITTYYNGDSTMVNTYGCDIKNVAMPSLKLSVDEGSVGRTKKWWAASGIYHAAYGATLTLTPSLPANIPNVYYYRLWRVEDGGAETLLNGLEENVDNTETKGWATTYGNLQWHYPDKKSAVSVRDIYIAEDKGVDKNVTYIARMYSTIVLPPQGAARKVQAATDKGYYISEDRITVKYSQETITGVADVEGAKQAVSVRYYNVAGQVSSTPFAGLNIERTTYSDGSVATRKVVK